MQTQRVILFHYNLMDRSGQVLDSSAGEEPMAILEGAGQALPGIEKALVKLATGEKRRVELSPEEAYGYRDLRRVMMVPRTELPEGEVKLGAMFQAGDDEHGLPFRVTEMDDVFVTLDGNHPLAGTHLTCDLERVGDRLATDEEIAHGHAHSGDGHHHHGHA